jgi:hypothetical protein
MKQQVDFDWRFIAVAVASLGLSACAGGFSQDLTQTEISTAPAGATCALAGKGFARTVKTPVKVILPKEASPIQVTCRTKGYRAFVAKVKPVFNEKILNNFLTGSTMGMVIDMMHGHDTKFPDRVHMNMEPSSFASVEERDAWYRRYRNHVTRNWDYAVRELSDRCHEAGGEEGNCMHEVTATINKKAKALAVLEQQRRRAQVRTSATARRPQKLPAIQ